MDEHLSLKGQRIITKDGEEGEVVNAIGERITVKLDKGTSIDYPSDELQYNNSAD